MPDGQDFSCIVHVHLVANSTQENVIKPNTQYIGEREKEVHERIVMGVARVAADLLSDTERGGQCQAWAPDTPRGRVVVNMTESPTPSTTSGVQGGEDASVEQWLSGDEDHQPSGAREGIAE